MYQLDKRAVEIELPYLLLNYKWYLSTLLYPTFFIMKKLLLLPILFFACTTSLFAQMSPGLQGRLDLVLDSVCTVYNIKGASAAVLMPGQGTWTGTFGESHAGTPITEDMYFGIGSNTKTFTSALMLKLQENGLLDLDDTIGTWIQNVQNVNGQITIRQLLNHTSGLYNFINNPTFYPSINANVSAIWQPEDVLPFIYAPIFPPGTDWGYSNTNYLIAGLIIKAVVGTSYHQALRDSILDPQGLTNTVFFPFETPTGPIPHGWSQYFGAPYLIDGIDVNWEHNALLSMEGAAGAIMSTAEDNVIFWDKLMSGNIINNASLNEMKQTIYIGGGTGYGLGIFRDSVFNGHAIYSHGGTNACWFNENIYDDVTGTCVSVLTNQDSISNGILLTVVVAALHKETLGPLSVTSTNKGSDISVYPNPANKYVNINTSEDDLVMYLSDISGRAIIDQRLNKGTTEIPLENIASGIYMIRIMNNDKQTVFSNKLSVY